MTDYSELVKALRCKSDDCEGCDLAFLDNDEGWMCQYAAKDDDAADAIEALQEQVRMLDKHDTDLHNEGYDVGYYAGRRDWEPKRGEWERELDVHDEPFYQCSVCGECFDSNRDSTHEVFKYCPDCGAKMEVRE